MENHDKIFNQIKTAAEKAEINDFPSMENVWSRIEGKLDKKVLKKENTLWKKIAIAASLLLFFSIVYHYFSPEKIVQIHKNDIVIIDSTKKVLPKKEIELNESTNPTIKKNAAQILEKQIAAQNQIVAISPGAVKIEERKITSNSDSTTQRSPSNSPNYNTVFSSRGVVYKDDEVLVLGNKDKKANQVSSKKLDPLIVIDNSASKQDINEIEADDIDTITILPDPLYIINGVNYSEKELFGPKPTSPYAPLSNLIIETVTVLEKEEATAIYGEKGKKGVVIITTKTGKPSFKKP